MCLHVLQDEVLLPLCQHTVVSILLHGYLVAGKRCSDTCCCCALLLQVLQHKVLLPPCRHTFASNSLHVLLVAVENLLWHLLLLCICCCCRCCRTRCHCLFASKLLFQTRRIAHWLLAKVC
jgi:hypothetical protein